MAAQPITARVPARLAFCLLQLFDIYPQALAQAQQLSFCLWRVVLNVASDGLIYKPAGLLQLTHIIPLYNRSVYIGIRKLFPSPQRKCCLVFFVLFLSNLFIWS
jgi:hypothetical protein